MAEKQSEPDTLDNTLYYRQKRDSLPPIPEDIVASTVFPKVDKTSFTPTVPAAGTAKNDSSMRDLEQTIGKAVGLGITALAAILKLGKFLPTSGVTGIPDPAGLVKDTTPTPPDKGDKT